MNIGDAVWSAIAIACVAHCPERASHGGFNAVNPLAHAPRQDVISPLESPRTPVHNGASNSSSSSSAKVSIKSDHLHQPATRQKTSDQRSGISCSHFQSGPRFAATSPIWRPAPLHAPEASSPHAAAWHSRSSTLQNEFAARPPLGEAGGFHQNWAPVDCVGDRVTGRRPSLASCAERSAFVPTNQDPYRSAGVSWVAVSWVAALG
mmetsp:Transcript_31858/g.93806  ORF Transcript_31858/g.93806 Transcript_31858/m.93806 type:complete len:206 (-) Transcript_31858:65-682(-)